MKEFPGDRLPRQLADALQHAPAVLVQDPGTPISQLGKLYFNLTELLGPHQLSQSELHRSLQLLLSKDITHTQLVNRFSSAQQQPGHQQSADTPGPEPADAAAETAKQPGILPWHTLMLSEQPLGIQGLVQMFLQLKNTQRLRSLVASHCAISGCFSGDVLQPTIAANFHIMPQWTSRLQWLDLSYNLQLQLLGPTDDDISWLTFFFVAADQLQGLCLQHTGLTVTQLDIMWKIMEVVLTEDEDQADQQPNFSGANCSKPPLHKLQCLKLGPISCDDSAAADVASSSNHPAPGWPAAAFDDIYERLSALEPPFSQLVVLELYGLDQQQQQQLADWVSHVSNLVSSDPSIKSEMMINKLAQDQPHITQPQPECCRLSWLKPRQLLEFEVPVVGLGWHLPPPKPVTPPGTPPAAADGLDAGINAAAMPFAMPAAAGLNAAGTGWTIPPPPAANSGGGDIRPQQLQRQPAVNRASAAAVGSRSVLDVLGNPGGGPSSFAHNDSRQQRNSAPSAAAAAARPRAAAQQSRQHRSRHVQQQRRQRAQRGLAWQPGIADYANQYSHDAAATQDDDWPYLHAAAVGSDDDDFMDPGTIRQQQRQRRPGPSSAAARSDDQGTLLGSQDSDAAAAGGSSPGDGDRGILAGLVKEHKDDLFSESDHDDQVFVFGALRADGSTDHGLSTGSGHEPQQQQQPSRRRRKKRPLQPIQFDGDYASPAAAAMYGRQSSSPTHRLPPLESPLSSVGLDRQQQQDSMGSPAAVGGSSDDDQAAVYQQDADPDADFDKWLAGDDDQDLVHGMYSQDEASEGSGGQDGGDEPQQQQGQQRRRRGSRGDDDPEGLRAFAFERVKRPGQGLGPKGQQVFGMAKEGEKRRQKVAIDDRAQARLQQLRSRYEQQQPAGPLLAQTQPQGVSNGTAAVHDTQGDRAEHLGSRQLGSNRRRNKSGRNRFVNDAAGGGGAYGYEEGMPSDSSSGGNSSSGGSSSSSEDSQDTDRRAGRGTLAAAAVGKRSQGHDDGAAAADGGADTHVVLTAPAAVGGGSRRRRVALLDSEPQDEADPLEALLQQHYEQHLQQQGQRESAHAAVVGGNRRRSRAAVLDSNPQDELDPSKPLLLQQDLRDDWVRGMLQEQRQQPEQQQQDQDQQEHGAEHPDVAAADLNKEGNNGSEAVQQASSKRTSNKTATKRRVQGLSDSEPPSLQLAEAAAASIAGSHQPTPGQAFSNADSLLLQQEDDEASDQLDDLDSIPEYRQWREAAAELNRLQEAKNQVLQALASAQAAAMAADGAPVSATPSAAAAAVVAGVGESLAQAATSAGLQADGGTAADGVAAIPGAVAAAADGINSLQEQLNTIKGDQKRQRRLVKFLKGNIPFGWDKRGPEARSFKHINQLKASKRQSRAPMRLSPGAIEQQERLMRLGQQQQQQQQQSEAFPVQPPAAARLVMVPARKTTAGVTKGPLGRRGEAKQGSGRASSSSSSSSSSESDSEDDVPLANLYQQRRNSNTPAPAAAAAAAGLAGDSGARESGMPDAVGGSGMNSSRASDRPAAEQHQQITGGQTARRGSVVDVDAGTAALPAAAAEYRHQAPVGGGDGDVDGVRRRTPRISAGKASKEFFKVFGSDYYSTEGTPPTQPAAEVTHTTSASAAAERADPAASVRDAATGLLAAAATRPVPPTAQQQDHQQQQQDNATAAPATTASAACTTTAYAAGSLANAGHPQDVAAEGACQSEAPAAASPQPAVVHVAQEQRQQQPQGLLPEKASQQQQEWKQQQHQQQLGSDSTAACAGQGVPTTLQCPAAHTQQLEGLAAHHRGQAAAYAAAQGISAPAVAGTQEQTAGVAGTAPQAVVGVSAAVTCEPQMVQGAVASALLAEQVTERGLSAMEVAVGSFAPQEAAGAGQEALEMEIPDSEGDE